MSYFEVNFDGLVGPNHNYSGLSSGNVASEKHGGQYSNPREAALQGLAKSEYLLKRGFYQGIILPQERPNLSFLRAHGFSGSDSEIVSSAFSKAPKLLSIAFSASNMWTANAATVVPSNDSADGKLHLVVANLFSKAHRAQEAAWTHRYLSKIFSNESFRVHRALEGGDGFSDEGAANHTRLAKSHSEKGFHVFVYGRSVWNEGVLPKKYVARQTLEASQSVARLAGVWDSSVFVQQNPEAIDAGVFHNDVISVGNENVFFSHEKAFTTESKNRLKEFLDKNLTHHKWIEVKESEISLLSCVKSYLFNSQLLRDAKTQETFLLCPSECEETPEVKSYLDKITSGTSAINAWISRDLRQSMHNGGGPACLRLRVQMSDTELSKLHPEALVNSERLEALRKIVNRCYRDKLSFDDLRDPNLIVEIRTALDEFTQVLKLGSLYEFQK